MDKKPLSSIVNTDYATLKNDSGTVPVSLNVPAGDVIAAGGTRSYSADVAVGVSGAPMDYQVTYSIGTQNWLTGALQVVEKDTSPTGQYQGFVYVIRVSPTLAQLRVDYYNGNASSTTTNARSVGATIRTFLPPSPI